MSRGITTVALAVIGEEVLLGEVEDQNIGLVSREVSRLGGELAYACVLPDDLEVIVDHLDWMRKRYQWVVTTGGIGATHDDVTKEAVSRIFGRPLVVVPEARKALEARLGEPLPERALELAMVPEGAEPITNALTAAPAFVIENVIVLPGVPRLVQSMLGVLESRIEGSVYWTRTLKTMLRESEIAQSMEDVQRAFPGVKIGSYPTMEATDYRVKVVLRSRDAEALRDAEAMLVERMGS